MITREYRWQNVVGHQWACWFLLVYLFGGTVGASPELPGQRSDGTIALVGADIYPLSAPPIESGVLVVRGGEIIAIGDKDLPVPSGTRRVALNGRSLYPGLFNTDGLLGLIEINSVRATRDYAEVGTLTPNVRAEVAVNPDSELIPVTRSGGVLLSLTSPQGGLVSGTSAILQLDGWTWEDLALKAPAAMHVRWPRVEWPDDGDRNEESAWVKSLRRLRELLIDARSYQMAASERVGIGRDLRLESMRPVLDREIPVIVDAERAAQIRSAVSFALEQNIRIVIRGGYDAELCAALLRQHDVPVIIAGVHRLPLRRHDPYDHPFTLPNRLRLAGVRYCLAANDRFDAPNIRNLPYQAGHATAYGLPRDEALKAITLYPAQILGIADRVGSLEVGKDATFIVTDGDPLETPTLVEKAYVQGREVDLSDRHKRLWRKYQERLRRVQGD